MTAVSAPLVAPDAARFQIGGMTCAACATRLESALAREPGVRAAAVNLALDVADVRFDPTQTTRERLIAAVAAAGFSAESAPPDRHGVVVLASALLTAPLVAAMAAHSLGLGLHLPRWLEFALATPIQFVFGAPFYRGAFASLRRGGANMDVLIALGTSAAYGLSVVRVIAGNGALFFESSAVIITLVLFGKWLEARAKAGATAAIHALMTLRPTRARIIRDDREHDIAVTEIAPGDIIVVRPGEKIPADGEIVRGDTECDESMITGESLPATRTGGDAVIGGAINGAGLIHIRATAVGADSALSKIIRIVEQAQSGKAPIQRLVDRISAVFVPVIVAIAALVFVGWLITSGDLDRAVGAAIAVIVIACPCALGLATPSALVAGTGAAARAGILIKNIDALERAARVDTAILDKTGTLTEGRPTVTDVALAPHAPADTLSLLAAAEAESEHVYARAVVAYARANAVTIPTVDALTAVPGRGVVARVAGHEVVVGTHALFDERGLHTDAALLSGAHSGTRLLAAIDGRHVATLTVADRLRPESRAAVTALQALGVSPVMLSGDQADVVAAIAKELSLSEARGALAPAAKAEHIAERQRLGAVVAMVGDGINDAPALATADVGIAIGGATDVAIETADITLLRPDPRLIAAAIAISRATRRKIRQNLFWALIYNVVAVPFAAAGALTPALAGAAMAASSLSVMANALRLRAWRPPR